MTRTVDAPHAGLGRRAGGLGRARLLLVGLFCYFAHDSLLAALLARKAAQTEAPAPSKSPAKTVPRGHAPSCRGRSQSRRTICVAPPGVRVGKQRRATSQRAASSAATSSSSTSPTP